MKVYLYLLAALCAPFWVAGSAIAEKPLVMFDAAGRTHVNCEFANHALSGGYFDKIVNPTITGTCPDATPTNAPEPVVGTPIVPFGAPIAPWCDCTDEEWQAVRALMAEQNVLINPGYESANPVSEWAKAFNTDTATIKSPDFWADGQVPAFNDLSDQLILELR